MFWSMLVIFLLVGFGINTALRFASTYTIYQTHWPGRIPAWAGYLLIPLILLGFIVAIVELVTGRTDSFRMTAGWRMVRFFGGAFLGAWAGGIISSLFYQLRYAWPLMPLEEEKKK